MDTGKAIVIGAAIIAATGGGTAFLIQPRYSLTNVGGGNSIRLNKASGDMVGCADLDCAPIMKGDNVIEPWAGDPIVNEATPSNATSVGAPLPRH